MGSNGDSVSRGRGRVGRRTRQENQNVGTAMIGIGLTSAGAFAYDWRAGLIVLGLLLIVSIKVNA